MALLAPEEGDFRCNHELFAVALHVQPGVVTSRKLLAPPSACIPFALGAIE